MYEFPEYITNNHKFLGTLAKSRSNRKRNNLINSANLEALLSIAEVCKNVLAGKFELSNRKRRHLSKSGDYYRSIAESNSAKKARNRIQTGGSLTALAAILSPVLGVLAQHILDKTLAKKTDNEVH
jgi:hypothetical protein